MRRFWIEALVLSIFLGSSARAGGPAEGGGFIKLCNEMVERVIRAVSPDRAGQELIQIFDRNQLKSSAAISKVYLDRVSAEWSNLGDPEYFLSVLKYPVPGAGLDALDFALQNHLTASDIERALKSGSFRMRQRNVLEWVRDMLLNSKFKDPALLKAEVAAYRKTLILAHDGVRYYTGVPKIPEPAADCVRLYKGSNFYRGPARSQSQAHLPLDEVLSGDAYFLSQEEANVHSIRAEAFHPDGVSVSKDQTVILSYGSHIRIYDVPKTVVANLPMGDRGLSEYVFRYSVPEKFRVMTLPKATYLEALKVERASKGFISACQTLSSGGKGEKLIEYLKENTGPILVRGRSLELASLFRERNALKAGTVEGHTVRGYEQMKKYAPFVDWTGFHAPPNVNVEKTMNFSFALHDIGKPVSREFGGSHEEISAEILTRLMDRAGFTKSEVELGRAMINNDAIGKMLQGYLSPQEAYEQIVEAAKQTNLSPRDFFKIQSFYYTVDASAYPKLEASVFKTVNGMLVPKSPKYEVLKNLFENVGVDE